MDKQKRLQEAWENLRWISKFIEENSEMWEVGKLERLEERRKKELEWEKARRFEKIAYLREKKRKKDAGIAEEENPLDMTWTWEEWRKQPEEEEPKEEPET